MVDGVLRRDTQKEERAWAAEFDGHPILSVEQSPFANDSDATSLYTLLSRKGTSFQGCFSTRMQHTVNDGMVHGFEEVTGRVHGLALNLHTYGQNSGSWAAGVPSVQRTDAYACEFWDVWEEAGAISMRQSQPLTVDRRATRLETPIASVEELRRNPKVIEKLAQAAARQQEFAGRPFDW